MGERFLGCLKSFKIVTVTNWPQIHYISVLGARQTVRKCQTLNPPLASWLIRRSLHWWRGRRCAWRRRRRCRSVVWGIVELTALGAGQGLLAPGRNSTVYSLLLSLYVWLWLQISHSEPMDVRCLLLYTFSPSLYNAQQKQCYKYTCSVRTDNTIHRVPQNSETLSLSFFVPHTSHTCRKIMCKTLIVLTVLVKNVRHGRTHCKLQWLRLIASETINISFYAPLRHSQHFAYQK